MDILSVAHDLGDNRGVTIGAFSLKAWPLIYAGPDENPFLAGASQIFFACSCALFLTNFLLILVHVAACVRRGFYFLIPWTLLMPFYWVLISVGAWKGALQLITKPFYWEKTIHGLDKKTSSEAPESGVSTDAEAVLK